MLHPHLSQSGPPPGTFPAEQWFLFPLVLPRPVVRREIGRTLLPDAMNGQGYRLLVRALKLQLHNSTFEQVYYEHRPRSANTAHKITAKPMDCVSKETGEFAFLTDPSPREYPEARTSQVKVRQQWPVQSWGAGHVSVRRRNCGIRH